MSISEPIRLSITIPPQLHEEIDDFRFANRIKTHAEAIRFLLEAGLVAKRAKISNRKPPRRPRPK